MKFALIGQDIPMLLPTLLADLLFAGNEGADTAVYENNPAMQGVLQGYMDAIYQKRGLGGRALERNLALYLNRPEDRFHPLVSPVLADLRGLPPVCLFAAALDPLFDDSFALASALRAQGGECYLIEMPGVAHCGVPFGYDPAFRTLMARLAADLLGAGKPGRPRGSAA